MIIKTLTWNIGGGKLLRGAGDPSPMASYTEDGLDSIANLLKSEAPDVITPGRDPSAPVTSWPGIAGRRPE